MCGSMADIQSAAAEIRRGKKKKKKKEEERTNHSMKIYMVSLFHRATINNDHSCVFCQLAEDFVKVLCLTSSGSFLVWIQTLGGRWRVNWSKVGKNEYQVQRMWAVCFSYFSCHHNL